MQRDDHSQKQIKFYPGKQAAFDVGPGACAGFSLRFLQNRLDATLSGQQKKTREVDPLNTLAEAEKAIQSQKDYSDYQETYSLAINYYPKNKLREIVQTNNNGQFNAVVDSAEKQPIEGLSTKLNQSITRVDEGRDTADAHYIVYPNRDRQGRHANAFFVGRKGETIFCEAFEPNAGIVKGKNVAACREVAVRFAGHVKCGSQDEFDILSVVLPDPAKSKPTMIITNKQWGVLRRPTC